MCVFTGLFTPGLTSPWYSPFDKTIVDRKSSENHADADPSLHRLHDGRENEDASSQEQVDCWEDQVHSRMEVRGYFIGSLELEQVNVSNVVRM